MDCLCRIGGTVVDIQSFGDVVQVDIRHSRVLETDSLVKVTAGATSTKSLAVIPLRPGNRLLQKSPLNFAKTTSTAATANSVYWFILVARKLGSVVYLMTANLSSRAKPLKLKEFVLTECIHPVERRRSMIVC